VADEPSVLVVVSDLFLRQKVVESLMSAGFRPDPVAGPGRMRERLAGGTPSCLVLDLDLAGVDSVELVRGLREDPATRALPLLGFCSHLHVDLRARGLAAGCDVVVARSQVQTRLDRLVADLIGHPPAA
jgi:CheY-like chemotaxis protein